MCEICKHLTERTWRLVRGHGGFSSADWVAFEALEAEAYAIQIGIDGEFYKLAPLLCRHGVMRDLCHVYKWKSSSWVPVGASEVFLSIDPDLGQIDARCEQIFGGGGSLAENPRDPWTGGDPLAGGWGAEGAGGNHGGMYPGKRYPARSAHSRS